MRILGPTSVTAEVAQDWAFSRGALDLFVGLAPLYWRFAPERGVKPEVAYAQAAKETGFGQFGGVVTPQFRNPCGLKTATASGDDPSDHQRFPTWEVGVQAHLDHLALYAGALGYPRVDTADPRHFEFLFSKSVSVEGLGGVWAPSPTYGTSLLADYIVPLLAHEVPPPAPDPLASIQAEIVRLDALTKAIRGEVSESAGAISSDLAVVAGELEETKRVLGEVHRAVVDAGNRLTQTI